ncbi:MAG: hypothetical protein COB41_05740 [Proteobacteria bacterium]|nr:MAG: hypothetical protein COB41_05740 [Pseudomonadota bacterium]
MEAARNEVWNAVDPSRKKNSRLGLRVTAAAAALLLLSAGFYFYHRVKTPVITPVLVKTGIPLDFKPGRNVATLTLSDGKIVGLGNSAIGPIGDQGAIAVEKQKDGFITYHDRSREKNDRVEAVNNTLTTPRGGEYHLKLSDGTEVWLNAASSITFPVKFNGAGERVVAVKGEAYFEVAHRDGQTFKVITGNQQITVLGTHFNVKAYDDDQLLKPHCCREAWISKILVRAKPYC